MQPVSSIMLNLTLRQTNTTSSRTISGTSMRSWAIEARQRVFQSIDTTSTVSSNVVTYYVLVALEGAPTGVKPGMTSTVQVTVDSRSDVLALPTAAVTTFGTGTAGTVRVRRRDPPGNHQPSSQSRGKPLPYDVSLG